jgi:ascorbate-specific PTS system EIIC-type component UlaA
MLEGTGTHSPSLGTLETVLGVILVALGALFVLGIFNKRVQEQTTNRNVWAPGQRVSASMHATGIRLSWVLGPLFVVLGLVLVGVGMAG